MGSLRSRKNGALILIVAALGPASIAFFAFSRSNAQVQVPNSYCVITTGTCLDCNANPQPSFGCTAPSTR